MDNFLSEQELQQLGIKRYGQDVKIGRHAVLYSPSTLEIGNHVRIDDYTTISGKVVLGDYIHIAQFCGLYGGTEGIIMDDFSGLSSRVTIYATSNDYSGNSLTNPTVPVEYKTTDHNEKVHLGKHAIVGCGSVLLPGAEMALGCSVGAMSLLYKKTEPFGIYAGIPARRIKERERKILALEKALREETSKSQTNSDTCPEETDSHEKYFVGQKAAFSKTVTETDVYNFSGICGDFNPIHVNRVKAENSAFGKQLVQGALISSFISTILGTRLPGEGTIYLEQDSRFVKPVFIGDTITASVELVELLEKGRAKFQTEVVNQNDLKVLDGFAVVKLPV